MMMNKQNTKPFFATLRLPRDERDIFVDITGGVETHYCFKDEEEFLAFVEKYRPKVLRTSKTHKNGYSDERN